jgi:hypothetical protein
VEGEDWNIKLRFHGNRDNGAGFETFVISMPNDEETSIHFDISKWYLKN